MNGFDDFDTQVQCDEVYYVGKAYFDCDDYTDTAVVELGKYKKSKNGWQRANTIATKKMTAMFPNAWMIEVAPNE